LTRKVRCLAFFMLGAFGAGCNSLSTQSFDRTDTGPDSTDLGAPRDLGPVDSGEPGGGLPSGGPLTVRLALGSPGAFVIDCTEEPGSEAGQLRADLRLEVGSAQGAVVPDDLQVRAVLDVLARQDLTVLGTTPVSVEAPSDDLSTALVEGRRWSFRVRFPNDQGVRPSNDLQSALRQFCREEPFQVVVVLRFNFDSSEGPIEEVMLQGVVLLKE